MTEGVAETDAPVLLLSPVEGLHVYVVAPLAFKLTLLPEHTEDATGVTVTVGMVPPTLTVTAFEPVQEPLVPVTV